MFGKVPSDLRFGWIGTIALDEAKVFGLRLVPSDTGYRLGWIPGAVFAGVFAAWMPFRVPVPPPPLLAGAREWLADEKSWPEDRSSERREGSDDQAARAGRSQIRARTPRETSKVGARHTRVMVKTAAKVTAKHPPKLAAKPAAKITRPSKTAVKAAGRQRGTSDIGDR